MADFAEPIYPLEKAAFIRALATGHGRAVIHAERFGTEDLREEILDAALFSKVYDSQSNGEGEVWLAHLCGIAGLVDRVIARNDGDIGLRCDMLLHFAQSGHSAARAALREMCRYDEARNDLSAGCDIVDLEGEEGYLFVVERAGEALSKYPDYWVSDAYEHELDRQLGDGRAMAILERESAGNPHIAAYREAVLAYRAELTPEVDRTLPAVDEVIRQILTSTKRIPRLRLCGEKATLEERRKVAALDFARMEPVPLENYLYYFQRVGFPDFREEYLPLLRRPETRIHFRAHSVLSHCAEPRVRAAAYDALERGELASYVTLLRRSGLAVDVEPLLEAIRVTAVVEDADKVHDVSGALHHLAEENAAMNDLRLPVWIYQSSPCRVCRYKAVNLMAERSILPQWIADECLSDAYDDTREIAAKYLGVERRF